MSITAAYLRPPALLYAYTRFEDFVHALISFTWVSPVIDRPVFIRDRSDMTLCFAVLRTA